MFGAEVNAASKLGEDIAKTRDILITNSVVKHAQEIEDISFEEIKDVPPGAEKAYRVVYTL